MYKSVESCFELYECTILLGLNYLTVKNITYLILVSDKSPRFWLSLLESERDLALFLIEGKNLDIDDVADLENFFRVLKLAPGDLRDVQKSVYSADIYECAVVGESHDFTFNYIANIQIAPDLSNCFALFLY